ncbi:hypothetical protein Mgra_00008867 [Meloidogyne graminicola]|uniref:Uncharacterized protein n=1 Tax=Meloidogyne graminicola TaxID=189291 RepID=A0A8S9ZEF6_9BILA|nr:hypothetical protein Mgra_00008867 [Meloidogyne graminicola]
MNNIQKSLVMAAFKNSQNLSLLLCQPTFSSQLISKRLLFYHYITKDKEDYEKHKKNTQIKFRWEKNPIGSEYPNRKFFIGHLDDPQFWGSMDAFMQCSPRFGENPKDFPEYNYRLEHVYKPPFLDRFVSKIFASLFWFWLFYNIYWNNALLLGHGYYPYGYEFTDEELGIPPDDASDPEYWGNHDMPYRTYR